MTATTEIRWLCKRDLLMLECIECGAFEHAWSGDRIQQELKSRETGGLVIESDGRVVGYTIFRLSRNAITILRLAVSSCDRRCGHGTALVSRLEEKAIDAYRRFVRATSDTADVRANKFLAACGLVPRYVLDETIHWSKEVSSV